MTIVLILTGLAVSSLQPASQSAIKPSRATARAVPDSLTPDGYRLALPPYRFQFPRDHAAHPAYRTEWWYYTGHLSSGDRTFGYELTFFRVGIDPKRKDSPSTWALSMIYFAHLAVTDENGKAFHYTENISRPVFGVAGASEDRYRTWIGNWSVELQPDHTTHRLKATSRDFSIALDLIEAKPPVIHGFNGVSQKASGPGRASHYYSITRMTTSGRLTIKGEEFAVTGLSWMDHEFGSNQLTPQQAGWDWFSIQLDNDRELMLYVMRLKNGGIEPMSSGTVVNADGTWTHLPLSAYQIQRTGTWKSPASRGVYPSGWVIRVPGEQMELRVTPTVVDQELVTGGVTGVIYWEGSVRVEGRDRGKPVKGVGYVELTGYAGALPGI
ncbi:MAG: carotenoid 1,2-hydratase [Candidatus Latescibacteria bacterium]|nr:carotenoid 1,2-hydratase [Candidatus Latescibacterota bacterium]